MSQIDGGVRPTTIQSQWEQTVDKAQSEGQGKSGVISSIKNGIKGLFSSPPTRSPESVDQTSQQFKSAFQDKLTKLAGELGLDGEQTRALQEKGQRALDDIVKSTFGFAKSAGALPQGQVGKQAVDLAVLTANTVATRLMTELRSEFTGPPKPPQVIPFKDESGNIKINVMKTAPMIENLVLRGGGAKGIGNAPALVELEKMGALSGLKQVVGTSAGALTAVALASGMNAKEFQDLANRTDFSELKGKPENWDTKYPMVKVSLTGFHAGVALQTLDRESAGSVKGFLDGNWDKVVQANRDGKITDQEMQRLSDLRNQNYEGNRAGQMITFKDLDILHRTEPSKFKQLTLTAWNDTDKKLTYMDVKNTPDMPIAIAGRMSMSIPVFFSSVKYDMGEGVKTWTDGGVGSNMPGGKIFDELEANVAQAKKDLELAQKSGMSLHRAQESLVKAERELAEARERTLLMTFDEGGKAYTKLHEQPKTGGSKTSLFGRLGGNKNMPEVRREDTRQVHEGGINTMVVFHGKMGTLDLGASPTEKAFASLTARMRALEFVEQRQNQLTYDTFSDMRRAAESLTPDERAQVLQSGAPKEEDFSDRSLFLAASEFHRQVEILHGVRREDSPSVSV